tara:strand:- start:6278 stop:6448 length:171 start_codon:yes stop_codon:yes gene_type:complete
MNNEKMKLGSIWRKDTGWTLLEWNWADEDMCLVHMEYNDIDKGKQLFVGYLKEVVE